MLTGKKLGPYKLTREAGRGEASTVYEAIDTRIGRTVAVKIQSLPANLLPEQREAMKLRVEREARSIGRLSHPNIVKIYVAGEQGNNHYIVMEYLDGITLRERLDAGPLPPAEAADILDQTAAGLDAVHAQGLVHRDIKPSNIMTMPDGHVKLTDFGVAHAADDPSLTTHGMMIGSPSYMSPEQAQGEPATPASDIWALGALLYHMLVGKPPFVADTVPSLLYKIVHEEPAYAQELPPELVPVLRQALDKNPALRFSSAHALAAAFREALGDATTVIYKPVVPAAAVAVTGPKILGRAVHSPLAGFTPRVPRPLLITPEPRRTRRIYQAAAAIALLTLGGTSLLLALRGRDAGSAEGSTASASLPESSPSATARPRPTADSTRTSPESATPPGPRRVAMSGVKPRQSPAATAAPPKTNPVRILSATVSPSARATPSVKPSPTAAASPAAKPKPEAGWQIGELLPPDTRSRERRPSPTPEADASTPPPVREAAEPERPARRRPSPSPRPMPREDVEPAPIVTEEEPPEVLTEEDAPPPPDAPTELRDLLRVWIDMTNERNIEEQMRFYAPRLERFYLDRNVSRATVGAEKTRLFGEASRVEMKAGDPRITFSPDGKSATMVFRKQYLIRNPRETRRGAVQQELRWKLLRDGWKIVSERDLSSEN